MQGRLCLRLTPLQIPTNQGCLTLPALCFTMTATPRWRRYHTTYLCALMCPISVLNDYSVEESPSPSMSSSFPSTTSHEQTGLGSLSATMASSWRDVLCGCLQKGLRD